jgi:hypothetical protein
MCGNSTPIFTFGSLQLTYSPNFGLCVPCNSYPLLCNAAVGAFLLRSGTAKTNRLHSEPVASRRLGDLWEERTSFTDLLYEVAEKIEIKNKNNINGGRWCRSVTLLGIGEEINGQLSEFPINLITTIAYHCYKNFIVLKDLGQYRFA